MCLSPVSIPIPTIPGSHVDHNGDHHDHNIESGPLPTILVDHYTIPECSDWQKDKTQYRPKNGAEHSGKPIGEKPEDYNKNSGKKESDHSKKTRHGRCILVLI
jgi:hypothetical protein